jgi:hypothetical protein
MKPRLLRTSLSRRARLAPAAAAPPIRWRPLSLCWPRRAVRAVGRLGVVRSSTVPQHHHTSLHLHFALPALRGAPPAAGSTVRLSPAVTPPPVRMNVHTHPRQLTLQHTHSHSAIVQRELTHSSILRRERTQVTLASNTVVTQVPRAPCMIALKFAAPTHARTEPSAPFARRAQHSVPSTPTAAPPGPSSAHELRAPASFACAFLPATPLEWRKDAPHAPATSDGASEAAMQRAMTPAMVAPMMQAAPPAAPVPTPQQVREAVRMNLFDGAIADRLADDVVRRVEKRLRIERERRGL